MIKQKDSFAPDIQAVREAVIQGTFSTERGPDGADYTGISMYQVPHWYELVSEVAGGRIQPTISCFRMNLKGELPHSWIHSDGICAEFASVLYMNTPDQCKGGTAFWKHKTRGIDRLLSKETLAAQGEDADRVYREIQREWKHLKYWQIAGFIPMKWNRFITYPTSLFHSRFPFEGFGAGPKDGRLIWICFYDIVSGGSA